MPKRGDFVLRWGASRFALALAAILSIFLPAFSAPDSLRVRAVAEGYWAATADSSSGLNRGPLYVLRHVEAVDDRDRPLDVSLTRGFAGAPASRKSLEALQAQVRRYLLDHGFPFAVIRTRLQPDSLEPNAVDAELRVHFGDAYKLGEPRLLETHTTPEVVRRLALWKVGEPYSEDRLGLGLNRLSRTGYFESVKMAGLFRDSTRNLIYPALRLPDLQDNQLSGLLGYDSKAQNGGQLTGDVDLHLINLFGTARNLDFTFNSQPAGEREAHLAYVEPWILNSPLGLRVELDFLQQDSTYWEWNRNLVLFQDLNFNSRMEIQFGDQENSTIGVQTYALRSGLSLIFDGRDRVPLTVSGYQIQVGVTGVRREAGDSLYYLAQGVEDAQFWLPLTPRLGIRLALHGATNFPLNRLNLGDLYYVGGANSLRGYQEREFPTNAYAYGQFEVQTWLGRKGRLFAFTDPGVVNRLVGEYSFRRVLGYGVGIELSKGDWGLSLSYALSSERGVSDGLLHVGVDNKF